MAHRLWFGVQPDTKAATLIFGLKHGFGVATKIQNHEISANGLLGNLIAFNIGVELGQFLALVLFLTVMAQIVGASHVHGAGQCRECSDDGGWLWPDWVLMTGYFVA